MDRKREVDEDENDPPATDVMSERMIDETLKETFPASDPPSWTLGVDSSREDHEDESDE